VSPLGGDFSLHGFNFFGKPITISTTFVIQMYSALLSQLILTRKLLVFGCQSHKKLLDINLTKKLQEHYLIQISQEIYLIFTISTTFVILYKCCTNVDFIILNLTTKLPYLILQKIY